MEVKDVLKLIKDNKIVAVDVRFMDFPGLWQHFTVPARTVGEDFFEKGLGIDGSSIRGWKAINESDMLVVPDAGMCFIDPFARYPTLVIVGNIQDPITRQDYGKDPRNIARKAEKYLASTGIGDTAFFGMEAEFFVFDDVRYDTRGHASFYSVDSVEGQWNTGREETPNLAHKPRYREGYFPVPPADCQHDLREEMVQEMVKVGLEVECHHHEVASGGQAEIDTKYKPLVRASDELLIFKYIVKNVARRNNKTATFMPKPIFGDNGSGMHTHVSLWKEGQPAFAGDMYAGLSQTALYAIGGIIRHAGALCAVCNPTTNSYKRLVPGYEAPVNLAYSSRNRSAAIRIPMYSPSPRSKRLEFRCPDPSANPYLALSAVLMAALDGIQSKLDPGAPLDKDIYDLPPEELAKVPSTPGSLEAALDCLEEDHEFLLKGDVFTDDVVDTWISYKRDHEVDALRLRPHPYEFALYYDV